MYMHIQLRRDFILFLNRIFLLESLTATAAIPDIIQ